VKLSLGGTMRTQEGVAFIKDEDGKTRTTKVGDKLGNGAKVESIEDGQIVIRTKKGHRKTLKTGEKAEL
jgi:Tfp pilus assembly protein PilP